MTTDDETREGWARARELFLDCLELDPSARERMLEEIRRDDPLRAEFVRRLLAQDERSSQPATPARFGPYAIVRRIAAGGMGEVFLGRRADGEFERDVAIKLLKPGTGGEHVVKRFQRERQTLARLDHECIARLYDGGTTESGEPYLVLEYVDGVPLDAFCRERNLELRARLELFLRVLAAVAHAHERSVVHRDLKPSNILVRGDGSPRLLDFGIARADDGTPGEALTRTGHRLFTPEYASPEQVQGRTVTPASDVFSLGVVLYQLLTGERPFGAELELHDLERAIVETDPPPPSRRETGTARRALAGDLDTIVMKCLAKEPSHRYANAHELAADLERYLRGLPIRARRTGLFGRAWRHGRRKPARLLAMSAVLVAVASGAFAWRWYAANETSRAELLETVRARLASARDLREDGRADDARTTLETALDVVSSYPEQGNLRAEVLVQLGVLANHASRWNDALARLAEARASLTSDRGEAPRVWASLLNAEAFTLSGFGDRERAWSVAGEALEHARAHLEGGDELWIDAVLEMCVQQARRGDNDAALATLEDAVGEMRARVRPNDSGFAQLLNGLGVARFKAGRAQDAVEPLSEALAIFRWHFGDGHPLCAGMRINLADIYIDLRRFADAEQELVRALEAFRAKDDHGNVAKAEMRLGDVAVASGDDAQALERYRASDVAIRRLVAPEHQSIRKVAHLIGRTQAKLGDLSAARASLEFALDPVHGVGAYGPALEADARACLGDVLARLGERDAARVELSKALALRERALGIDHSSTRAVRESLERL